VNSVNKSGDKVATGETKYPYSYAQYENVGEDENEEEYEDDYEDNEDE
jgi:hypothetical protein